MLKKNLLTMILTILLVACGQSTDGTAGPDSSPTNENKTETVTDSYDDQADDPNSNPDQSEVKAEDAARTTEQPGEKTANHTLGDLEVHYIDAGQADAALFQYQDVDNSYTLLYDTGDWNKNDVINYLDAQNISTIDLVMISHPHADHIGQLARVMDSYDVGEVWMNGAEAATQTFQQAMEAIIHSDADYAEPQTGDQMEVGPIDIEVLHPSSLSGDLNKDSLSLRLSYGNISFVFTGDAYKADELAMSNQTEIIRSTILQLGHHGSDTSSDPAFIQAVDPDVAIYSAGTDNSYGHPHPEVVSLIQDTGITLYGTDQHGTIIVRTDGIDYDVKTQKDGTVSPESTGNAANTASREANKDPADKTKTQHTAGGCISINQASAEELQAIIHIGPARAQDVIEQRTYDTVEDLTKVNGIGPARIADIKNEGLACTGG